MYHVREARYVIVYIKLSVVLARKAHLGLINMGRDFPVLMYHANDVNLIQIPVAVSWGPTRLLACRDGPQYNIWPVNT